MTPGKLVASGIATWLLYLSLYLPTTVEGKVAAFILVNALAFVPLGLIARRVFLDKSATLHQHRNTLLMIILFGIVFRLSLVPLTPIGSDDIYRYVWDGRVALSGVNPFALPPYDPRLSSLHTEDLPSKINFPDMRTIYPPFAQLFFVLSNVLFGDSIAGMKILLVLCDLGSMILLVLLLKQLTLNPSLVVLYGWSPVPIMYFGVDGHIDALGIPLLLLSLYVITKGRRAVGAIALGLAALAKLYPMFIVPFLIRLKGGWKANAVVVIPPLIFMLGCWAYIEPTGGLVESFRVFTSQFEFNGSVFSLAKLLTGSGAASRLICASLFVAWLLVLMLLNRTLIEKTFLAFLGFVLLSPVVHPWYLSWLAALIVLRWSPATFLLLVLSNISNIVVYQYRATGVWEERAILMILEYVPFVALLAWEISRGKLRQALVVSS